MLPGRRRQQLLSAEAIAMHQQMAENFQHLVETSNRSSMHVSSL